MSDRPTHLHVPSGTAVFPEGYDPAALQLLADGFWAAHDRAMAIAAIKAEAAAQIEAIAPLWRQANALRNPDDPASVALFDEIDAIRRWSNEEESRINELSK